MKYCQYCGSEVQATDLTCSNCGGKLSNNVSKQKTTVEDTGGFGWGLLGFCIPLVGLILFLVWNGERPKTQICRIRSFNPCWSLCFNVYSYYYIFSGEGLN